MPEIDGERPDLPIGGEVVWRLVLPSDWIHRRVETVRFLDEDTLRRRVSVDCDVSWSAGGDALVPLARLAKRPLVSFSLTDEAGVALPVLTTHENGLASWNALVAAASMVLDGPVPRSIQVSLWRNVFASPHWHEFASPPCFTDAVRLFQLVRIDEQERALLCRSPGFRLLVQNLYEGFLMLTPVAPDEGRTRRVLKYEYAEPLYREQRTPWRQSVGLRPLSIDFHVPLVGEGQSYHLECEVPEDLQIVDAELRAITPDGERTAVAVGRGERVHLFLSEIDPDVDPVAEGTASVRVRPSPGGMLRTTALSAAAILLTLVVGAVFADHIQTGSDAAAAMLLVLPGVLSAVVSRPGEHRLSSLALRGLRWCVAVTAGCSFAAGGLIALSFDATTLRCGFGVLLAIALVPALLTALALRRARKARV